jgi:hypothetical protein
VEEGCEAGVIPTFGVWLGDKPMPEHCFDEVITDVPAVLRPVLDVAEYPGGKEVVTRSDVVRIYEGMRRPGWLYHDFDCRVKSLPKMNGLAHFARYGKKQVDYFLFYTGDCRILKELFAEVMIRCLRAGKVVFAFSDVHAILNQTFWGKVGVIEPEHFVHGATV